MRILVIGAGGVGSAFVPIAIRRDVLRATGYRRLRRGKVDRVAARAGDARVSAATSMDPTAMTRALIREHGISTSSTRSTRGS